MASFDTIVLVRVDDRLIHGQVMTAWLKVVPAEQVLIIDDDVAADSFLSGILQAAAPAELDVVAVTVGEGADILQRGLQRRTYVLVKTPLTLTALLAQGISFREVNVGGIGKNAERKTLYKNVSASGAELAAFRELTAAGTRVVLQIVPAERAVDFASLDETVR